MIARGRMPTAPAAAPCSQTKGEQRFDRGRERRARRAKREEGEAGEHDRLAAEAVGERPYQERSGRETGEEDRDRRRRFRLGRVEIGLEERQARQRHIDRQWRQDRQRGEKQREAEPMDVEAHHQAGAPPGRVTSQRP